VNCHAFVADGEGSSSFELLPWGENDIYEDLEKEKVVEKNLFPTEEGLEQGQAAAVLVDAETTSFLMMGLLSSGPFSCLSFVL